ncbi:hypothetical protein Kpho02_19870 [Kitasatospora phosalacinea]|uniref:SMI1/KNR4 family protein n=1 Tax=Kitasatospora phosalacinea TaxID=2065 RepID=A0A9W6Q715_9ACTN|nr:hypothetical protein Kpho02_19870 [Kitasatospora phosalacinea]
MPADLTVHQLLTDDSSTARNETGPPGRRAGAAARRDLGATCDVGGDKNVETHAPVTLNHHLVPTRPDTRFFDLAERLGPQIKGLEESDWDGAGVIFRGATPTFGGPDGLIPVARTDRREGAFLVRSASSGDRHMAGVVLDGRFVEYEMGFSEWLHRYLVGEDMFGPRSGVFHPGPLMIEALPEAPGDAVTARRGPARMI